MSYKEKPIHFIPTINIFLQQRKSVAIKALPIKSSYLPIQSDRFSTDCTTEKKYKAFMALK